MSDQIVRKLSEHVTAHDLRADDLLFARRGALGPRTRSVVLPEAETLGWTEPNEAGRRYRHGTTTAYGLGRCRCAHCRYAVALYRAERRRKGKDRPSQGSIPIDVDPHLHASTFRMSALRPALRAAGVDGVTFHGLRHAHASWLLAGGTDLQVVKERLGHAKISTTEGYLHTLPDADQTALAALGKIRSGGDSGPDLDAARREIDELRAALVDPDAEDAPIRVASARLLAAAFVVPDLKISPV